MHFGILCRNIGLSAGFGPLAQCKVNVVGHLGTPSGYCDNCANFVCVFYGVHVFRQTFCPVIP